MNDIQQFSDKIKAIFAPFVEISDEIIVSLLEMGKFETAEKNQISKDYNKTETQIRFVIGGCIGFFIQNKNIDKCFYFTFENDFATDYQSLIGTEKYKTKLVALAKTELFVIDKTDYFQFCNEYPVGEKLMHITVELLYNDTQNQYFDLLTMNATERYLKLLQKDKSITQKIDHKHIASFLGITPQSLSRLRKTLLYTNS